MIQFEAGGQQNAMRECGKVILPGSTIGVLGGGQLGRMIVEAGSGLGYQFITLDPTENGPMGQVSHQITANYDDVEAALKLAEEADVITYEFENVDAHVARILMEKSYVPQGSQLLYTTQHRLREKRAIEAAGVEVAPYREIKGYASLVDAVQELGLPAVLKTATGGYDGKGQVVLREPDQMEEAYQSLSKLNTELVLEQFIAFEKEISVIAARSVSGEVKVFPAAENIHVNNILHLSIVPARIDAALAEQAEQLALSIAKGLDAVGLIAVEMFVTKEGKLYVNELAPRPHNSGHYTMEACYVSQFEQHVRAICNLPLSSTRLRQPVVMVNVLGQHMPKLLEYMQTADQLAAELEVTVKVHLYGKADAVHNRKMGHVNVLAHDVVAALKWIEQTAIWQEEWESWQ